eukprot:TRINITY_DN6938_c0_g2_i1.p1 TRINITY_DN6938_c0_g2~~TRINITY_DN6938_c0_g2_i1.p1  ORF type:complete len:492 (-),score=51.94 TRINITY_DN6938_c0_g2_i1:77-1489(-)
MPATSTSGFDLEERVFVHGLTSERGRAFNLWPARVIEPAVSDGERIGVEILHRGTPTKRQGVQLSIRPCNLLRASKADDRRRALLAQAVATTPALRVIYKFLVAKLPGGHVPSLDSNHAFSACTDETSPVFFRIASFVADSETLMHQFSGYMGQLWFENWWYDSQGRPNKLGSAMSTRGFVKPRLDCAVADLGEILPGSILFAGGCGAHPARCIRPHGFFKSAVLYDSLLDEWSELPDMTTRRHGPAAARVGRKVYVLGGQYVNDEERGAEESRFCEVFDLDTWQWSSSSFYPQGNFCSCFFGAGSVDGRVVACLSSMTVAMNPAREADGWRVVQCSSGDTIQMGSSSCAAVHHGELVVASGRPQRFDRKVAAFRFTSDDPETWHHGEWRQLPDLNDARVGGALVVIAGKLFITGGVDEVRGVFRDTAECLDEQASPPCWRIVPSFKMPRALHAHDCAALPILRNWRQHR